MSKELSRRKFLAFFGAATAGLACGPTSKPTKAPPPGGIPANIRGALPENIARATEEAMRPPPTPDRRFREPDVSDIRIKKEVFARCAPHPEDPMGNDMWGGWVLKLEHPNYFLRSGEFEFELLTPSGGLIDTRRLPSLSLASEIPHFFLAGGSGGRLLSARGSKLGSVRLRPSGRMEWAAVDNSPTEYEWADELLEIGYTPDATAYAYPYDEARRGRPRSLKLGLNNTGERAIEDARILAFVTNGDGELVDILVGFEEKIPFGGSKIVEARSLSYTGRCPFPPSDRQTLFYWVEFSTYTGMPVSRYYEVDVPGW